jgi:hypothetical protein
MLYYIEPNEIEKKTHRESDFWGFGAEITGTLSEHDGHKWITPTRIRPAVQVNPPAALIRPDRPLVMPKAEPIELKINEKLSIRCVPIPAGSFLEGSPLYQWPRCHDEWPHEVVQSNIGNKHAAAVAVKTMKPNAWGCYDLYTFYGWHACSDLDGENPPEKQTDPQGPAPGAGAYNKGGHRALGGDQNGVRPNIHSLAPRLPRTPAVIATVGSPAPPDNNVAPQRKTLTLPAPEYRAYRAGDATRLDSSSPPRLQPRRGVRL